jgi:O-antigen chain-terminating methyltransferase
MEPEDKVASEVDVTRIMDRLRSQIQEKMTTGQYQPEDLERVERMTLQVESAESFDQEGDILYQLSQMNYLCDTGRPPELSSHRKTIGPVVLAIKKAVRTLSDPYVQMILKRQVTFNVELVRLLNQMVLDYRYRLSNQEKQIGRLEKLGEQLSRTLEDIPQELRVQKNVFEEVLSELKAREDGSFKGKASLEELKSQVRDPEYVRFEQAHRGAEEEIKWKQKQYLPYFKEQGKVLDLGCGRGEFLELLKEAGVPASGVELNRDMVAHCLRKGLDVVQGDGLVFLRGLADNSLGGIFLAQVIEHLDPETLRDLVRLSFAKLAPGGVLLAETINPQCLTTFSGAFYLDLSHRNPIHPEAARFLWEALGFRQVAVLYVSPYPEEMKLKEMIRREDDSYEDELARVLNEDVRRLNALMYGYQDYAVLGYK